MPTERSPSRLKSEVGEKDRDKNRRHRLQDALPLEISQASDSKQEVKDASHMLDSKTNGQSERINHSDSTSVPRPRSFFQHDDRRAAARDGRYSERRLTSERGWWKDSKEEERAAHNTASSDPKERVHVSRVQGGDNHVWRHDRFSETGADTHPPTKKRRPFREEKVPVEAENVKNAVIEPSKVARPASSAAGTGRWEERSRDRRPLERNEHDRAYARERFSNRGRVDNTGFPPRDRINGLDNGGRYKGRDNFGGRQGYRSSGGRVEKWKHDLFHEANRSPTPKNEEDPVAKAEALLSL
ncbi:Armadillo repeat-containing protein 8 [Bienertia sinuspersici]